MAPCLSDWAVRALRMRRDSTASNSSCPVPRSYSSPCVSPAIPRWPRWVLPSGLLARQRSVFCESYLYISLLSFFAVIKTIWYHNLIPTYTRRCPAVDSRSFARLAPRGWRCGSAAGMCQPGQQPAGVRPSVQVCSFALDCIEKLLAYGYLRGDPADPTESKPGWVEAPPGARRSCRRYRCCRRRHCARAHG